QDQRRAVALESRVMQLLTRLALELLGLALDLHLLVAEGLAHVMLRLAAQLLDLALAALRGLCGFLLALALELIRAAFGLHVLVADDLTDRLLRRSTELLDRSFTPLADVAHDGLSSAKLTRREIQREGGEEATAEPRAPLPVESIAAVGQAGARGRVAL